MLTLFSNFAKQIQLLRDNFFPHFILKIEFNLIYSQTVKTAGLVTTVTVIIVSWKTKKFGQLPAGRAKGLGDICFKLIVATRMNLFGRPWKVLMRNLFGLESRIKLMKVTRLQTYIEIVLVVLCCFIIKTMHHCKVRLYSTS